MATIGTKNQMQACLFCLVLVLLLCQGETRARKSPMAEQLVQQWKSASRVDGEDGQNAVPLDLSRFCDPLVKQHRHGRVLDILYSLDVRFLPALKTSLGSVLQSATNSTTTFRFFVLVEHPDSNPQSGSAVVIATISEWIREAGGSRVDRYLRVSELRSLDDEDDCEMLPSLINDNNDDEDIDDNQKKKKKKDDGDGDGGGNELRGCGLNVILYVGGREQRETLELMGRLPSGQKEQSLVAMPNIIRNWAHRFLLPFGVQRALYLDVDAVVVADLQPLFDTPMSDHDVVTVARRPERAAGSHFNYSHPLVQRAGLTPRNRFNAGVVLFNLRAYCRARVTHKNTDILRQQIAAQDLWLPGRSTHQTPFILAVGGRRRLVPSTWNLCSSAAKILHCPSSFRSEMLGVSPFDGDRVGDSDERS